MLLLTLDVGLPMLQAWHLHYLMADGDNGPNPGSFLANLPGMEGPELMTRLSQRLSQMGMSVDGMQSITNWDEALAHGGLESTPSVPPGQRDRHMAKPSLYWIVGHHDGIHVQNPASLSRTSP